MSADKRAEAILQCYGLTAVKEKRVVVVDNEEITYWFVDGFLELDNLQATFSDEQIVDIYDSGE